MRDVLPPGAQIAGYRIHSVAGRGGMGVVYRAEHVHLGRMVALKTLPAGFEDSEEFRERFVREARAVAALEHPHIVPVYDAGEVDGLLYLAMRFVDGTDLAQVIEERGALEAGLALAVLGQVADALDAAHAKGVLHRDVKPANVLLERLAPPKVFLADFGLTKQVAATASLTSAGQVVGTIAYMAPEQLEGARLDGRVDQYALGCVLFECLTGVQPFRTDSDSALPIIAAHLHDPPPPVTAERPDLPSGLDAVVARALAKRPGQRYASCSALIEDARHQLPRQTAPAPPPRRPAPPGALTAPSPLPPPTPSPPPGHPAPRRPRHRRAGLTALLVAGVATLGVVGALALGDGGGPRVDDTPTPSTPTPSTPTPSTPTATDANQTAEPTSTPSRPALPPPDEVAFVGRVEGNAEVYLAASGGPVRNLTQHPAEDLQPDWSPDRSRVVVASNRDGRFCLHVITTADGSTRPLVCPEGAEAFDPSWSPDGQLIAFSLQRERRSLAVTDLDGQVQILTDGTRNASRATWTPDGGTIGFHGEADGGLRLFALDLPDGSPVQTTDGPADAFHPAVAPDGEHITFTLEPPGADRDVVVVTDLGAEPTTPAPHPADDLDSDFSPDGEWLAFVSVRDGNEAVWLVRLDGEGLVRLHDGSDPAW